MIYSISVGDVIPHFKKQMLDKILIPLPPLDIQTQFAQFVEQVDKSKSVIQKSLDETQLLFDSLMQQYFG